MLWTFAGKHKDKDINDVPTDYLEWAATKSKNPEAKAMAVKALSYRNAPAAPTATNNTAQSSEIGPRGRAKILTIAVQMDPLTPFKHVQAVQNYIMKGELPSVSGVLGEQPTEEPEKKFLSELDDDNPVP